MKTDYPELEGKIIDYNRNPGFKGTALVIGCFYHVGITIVSAENKSRKLTCINNKVHGKDRKHYRKLFHFIVKQIQEGTYTGIDPIYANLGNGHLTCAFGA